MEASKQGDRQLPRYNTCTRYYQAGQGCVSRLVGVDGNTKRYLPPDPTLAALRSGRPLPRSGTRHVASCQPASLVWTIWEITVCKARHALLGLASGFPSCGPAGVRQVQQKPANHLLPEVSLSRGGAANLVVNHCTCIWHLAPAPVLAPCPGPRPYLPTPPDATLPGHLPAHPVCGLGHRCVPSSTCVPSFKLRLRPPISSSVLLPNFQLFTTPLTILATLTR